ncbi:MAG: hypothetical protein AAGL89_00090 [Pseudomonadota bacterium]
MGALFAILAGLFGAVGFSSSASERWQISKVSTGNERDAKPKTKGKKVVDTDDDDSTPTKGDSNDSNEPVMEDTEPTTPEVAPEEEPTTPVRTPEEEPIVEEVVRVEESEEVAPVEETAETGPDPVAEPVEEPVVEEEQEQTPTEPVAEPVDTRVATTNNGNGPESVDPVAAASGDAVSILGGRTTTIEIEADKSVASIELIGDLPDGHANVNPDNSIAIVMSGSAYTGEMSLQYKVTYTDGSSSTEGLQLNVQVPAQGAGWGEGDHYMLATDAKGDIVVETGENHRKVYVSEDEDALTKEDIAILEGLSPDDIDAAWLMANDEYGSSPDTALAPSAGMELWYGLTSFEEEPGSHWLLLESGHVYSDLGKVVGRGAEGESQLNPLHITSYGEGAKPVITGGISISQMASENIVVSNVHVTGGIQVKDGTNVLVTDTDVTEKLINIRGSEDFTLHDSTISYTTVASLDGSGVTQGFLGVDTSGILLTGNVFHHNGWEDGYNPTDGTDGAPDMFSHNVYLQWNTTDVTYTDNISSQSSSVGAQLRGGAYAEDNLFLDNNVAVNFLGGNYKNFGNVGNFTYFGDNVITSGSYKDAAGIGGKGWGTTNGGAETTMHDNIITHLADPDDPSDLEDKVITRHATSDKEGGSTFYDDTIVLNWLGSDPTRWKDSALDRNIEDVNVEQAMQTTIQRYAAELTNGEEATIEGLMTYVLSLSDSDFDDNVSASDIVDYFQTGFGLTVDSTTDVTSHTFIPNDLVSGVRWDNKLNWDSAELPTDGDDIDLNGNWVSYSVETTRVNDLELGDGAKLSVTSGLLGVEQVLEIGGDDAEITIDGAGQFWTNGFSGEGTLQVSVDGGRFANEGTFDGDLVMNVGDDAQAILATDDAAMVLMDASEIRINGSDAKVGFDGDSAGSAILQMADQASLSFVSDAEGFSTVREFHSGAFEDGGNSVSSGVSLDGSLNIDLTGYQGGAGSHDLIEVDALQGVFDDIHVHGLDLGFTATVKIDYTADKVSLDISEGSGPSQVALFGEANDGADEAQALWSVLTAGQGTFDDAPPKVEDHDEMLAELY